jgi:hypothetical protein
MKIMKRIILLLALGSLFINSAFTQITESEEQLRTQTADSLEGWKKGGIITLNLSQISLTNWAAGGQNAFSVNGLINLFANYKKNKNIWSNSLDIGYGVLKQGKDEDFIKTDDKIDLLSKYGREAVKNWYYAALFNFKTQMTAGYNYPNDSVKISDLFAPAYILGSLGMDYKPNDDFSTYISPLTSKITIVTDQNLANQGAFGVNPAEYDGMVLISEGDNVRFELGGYLRIEYRKELMENITVLTKLDLFSNYLDKPDKIDVGWETLITMKVNKYISATLNTHLIFDYDIKFDEDTDGDGINDDKVEKVQFKEVLGIGLSYNF